MIIFFSRTISPMCYFCIPLKSCFSPVFWSLILVFFCLCFWISFLQVLETARPHHSSEVDHVPTDPQRDSDKSHLLSLASTWYFSEMAYFTGSPVHLFMLVSCSRIWNSVTARASDIHVACELADKFTFHTAIKWKTTAAQDNLNNYDQLWAALLSSSIGLIRTPQCSEKERYPLNVGGWQCSKPAMEDIFSFCSNEKPNGIRCTVKRRWTLQRPHTRGLLRTLVESDS